MAILLAAEDPPPRPRTLRAIGIDFGTTDSVIAVIEGGELTVISNRRGSTTPSVVAFSRDGSVLIGAAAVRAGATNADRTIRSVKRRISTDWKIEVDDTVHSHGSSVEPRLLPEQSRLLARTTHR